MMNRSTTISNEDDWTLIASNASNSIHTNQNNQQQQQQQQQQENMLLTFEAQKIVAVFLAYYNPASEVYTWISRFIVPIGLIGSICGLVTMFTARNMQTPSYNYHKALMMANMIFCANWCVTEMIWTERIKGPRGQTFWTNSIYPFYKYIFARVVTSTTGYIWLYATVLISLDRFVALYFPINYRQFNQHRVSGRLLVPAGLLSLVVHSWSPWFEKEILAETIHYRFEHGGELFVTNISLYSSVSRISSVGSGQASSQSSLITLMQMKDFLNAIIRISYPMILTLLTAASIVKFSKQRQKRLSMSTSETDMTMRARRKQRKRDRSLFLLMVIPRESKRILNLFLPKSYQNRHFFDESRPMAERLQLYKIALYSEHFVQLIANLTSIMRTILFYVYVSLNPSFRLAVITSLNNAILRLKCQPLHDRKDSGTSIVSTTTTTGAEPPAMNNHGGRGCRRASLFSRRRSSNFTLLNYHHIAQQSSSPSPIIANNPQGHQYHNKMANGGGGENDTNNLMMNAEGGVNGEHGSILLSSPTTAGQQQQQQRTPGGILQYNNNNNGNGNNSNSNNGELINYMKGGQQIVSRTLGNRSSTTIDINTDSDNMTVRTSAVSSSATPSQSPVSGKRAVRFQSSSGLYAFPDGPRHHSTILSRGNTSHHSSSSSNGGTPILKKQLTETSALLSSRRQQHNGTVV